MEKLSFRDLFAGIFCGTCVLDLYISSHVFEAHKNSDAHHNFLAIHKFLLFLQQAYRRSTHGFHPHLQSGFSHWRKFTGVRACNIRLTRIGLC